MSVLLGSNIMRPMNLEVSAGFAGNDGLVIFTSVSEPVVVAQTSPFCNPTTRKLSFCGEIAMLLMGEPTETAVLPPGGVRVPVGVIGDWLTIVIVSPRSVDR